LSTSYLDSSCSFPWSHNRFLRGYNTELRASAVLSLISFSSILYY
jgi:hypothetical protein